MTASRGSLGGVLGPTFALSLSAFLVLYAEAMLYPSLPVIQADFNITQAEASWIFASYLIAGSVATPIIGRLGDVYGKKRVLLMVLSLFGTALTLNSFAPSYRYFVAVRALQGVGMTVSPLAYAIIREQFPPSKAPVAQGLVSAMNGTGLIVALPIGGWVTGHLGWRVNFTIIAPMVLAAIAANALTIQGDERAKEAPNGAGLNLAGAAFFTAFIVPLLVVISTGYSGRISPTVRAVLLLIAGAVFTLFYLSERRSSRPLIPLNIMNRNVKVAVADAFALAVSFQMDVFVLAYLLQTPRPNGYGLAPSETGLYMVVIILSYALAAPAAGRLITLLRPKRVTSMGSLIASIGYIAVAYDPLGSLYRTLGMLSLGSSGRVFLNTSLVNLVTFSVEQSYLATATSLYSLMRNLGFNSWAGCQRALVNIIRQP